MNDKWSAFVDKDLVIEPTVSGQLDGLTFVVKDVIAIRGYTSGAGNPEHMIKQNNMHRS